MHNVHADSLQGPLPLQGLTHAKPADTLYIGAPILYTSEVHEEIPGGSREQEEYWNTIFSSSSSCSISGSRDARKAGGARDRTGRPVQE